MQGIILFCTLGGELLIRYRVRFGRARNGRGGGGSVVGVNNGIVVEVLAQAVLYGTPILFAALGELLAERSGVLNLGVEGMMLVGAVMGFWGMQQAPGPEWLVLLLAVLTAAFAGLVMSSIFAFLAVTLRASQIVSGLALTIFAGGLGLSSYLGNDLKLADVPAKHQFSEIDVFGLADLPVVGPILFHQNALVYASWALVVLIALYLGRTRPGLNVRAGGRTRARPTRWGSAPGYRDAHVLAGGAFAGIGGACYSLAITPGWTDGDSLVGGAGWIAIALVIFSFWRPELCLAGAYLFGALSGGLPVGAAGAPVRLDSDVLPHSGVPQCAPVPGHDRRARGRIDRVGAPAARRTCRARNTVCAGRALMEVLSPTSLEEALRVKAEHPEAVPIQGGTDVMVELNFDRRRPEVLLNLNEVPELRGWSRENGRLRLGVRLPMRRRWRVSSRRRCRRWPRPPGRSARRRFARGTIGGNLGTASPAGDALPPLLVEGAEVELASVHGSRTLPLGEFLVGPKRNAAEPDELITAVWVAPSGGPQTFMRSAAERDGDRGVLAAVLEDRERGELRAAVRLFGTRGRVGLMPARRCRVAARPRRRGGEPDRRRPRHGGVPATCVGGTCGTRAGAGADVRSFAFGSLPWRTFPHGPLLQEADASGASKPSPLMGHGVAHRSR